MDALTNLGLNCVSKNNYDKAIEYYTRALEIDPNDPLTWDSIGNAYEHDGRKEEAEKAYQKAHELAPEDPEIMGHLKSKKNK